MFKIYTMARFYSITAANLIILASVSKVLTMSVFNFPFIVGIYILLSYN